MLRSPLPWVQSPLFFGVACHAVRVDQTREGRCASPAPGFAGLIRGRLLGALNTLENLRTLAPLEVAPSDTAPFACSLLSPHSLHLVNSEWQWSLNIQIPGLFGTLGLLLQVETSLAQPHIHNS